MYKLHTLKQLSNYKNYVTIHHSLNMPLKIQYNKVAYGTPDTFSNFPADYHSTTPESELYFHTIEDEK
jgi:hypothetical protein